MNRRSRRVPGGFTMVEMLVVLGLLTAFALVAARLFTASMRALEQSRTAETRLAAFENAMGRLRADTWGASGMTVDGGTLTVTMPGRPAAVTWTTAADGTLTRAEGEHRVTWKGIPKGLTFAAGAGPAVTVRVPDGKGVAAFVLVSQVRLAAAAAGGGR